MAIIRTALVYFDQAIRDGSIRKAAENLNIASSAVNRQLLQLEDEFGVELFERLPRGIRPTAAGEVLLNYVRQWNRDSVKLRHEVGRLSGGTYGTIHIAAAESLTREILPQAMSKLQKEFPLIDFTLISGDNYHIKSALLAKDADMVCAFDVSSGQRTDTVISLESEIGVITLPGHPLAKKKNLTISDCVDHPIVAPSESWCNHSVLRGLFEDKNIPFKVVARTERIGMLINMVQAGLGIAFLSPIGLSQELEERKLAWTPLASGVVPPTTVSLLLPKGRVLPPYIHAFVELVREELESLKT